jgi:hypothetical protein
VSLVALKGLRVPREWRWGIPLVMLATLLRLAWVLAVPTVPVGDFATYRESANFLLEFGYFDHGFIYMPGFVVLLAGVRTLGGELIAQKMLGVFFGGIAAAAVFGVTAKLDRWDDSGTGARACPCPTAVIATLIYALWPAGIALASVVGTDVPAASLMMCALWALTAWGERRPMRAALAFGAIMGLAAYVRAVALPLTLMSIFYWAALLRPALTVETPRARRRRWRDVIVLTALGTAATLLVLLPWGLRNKREHGALSFTDDHGGITALIGANPNSEGTYTRALNVMFHDLTGRTVLDEPHRETDRLAYDLAKDWSRFEPRYALGLAALKAQRLFAPERHLLYWPIGRPGVLIGPAQRWFDARAVPLGRLCDGFWLALIALYAAGVSMALSERRWIWLALLPFQLALAATYTFFFAEPRYRIPIQMMAFPIAAFALHQTLRQTWTLAAAIARRPERRAAAQAARRLAIGAAGAVVCFFVAGAVADAGARLRVDHRWAATVWQVDGQARLAKWRRAPAPADGASPISGAPNGARLALAPNRAEGVAAEVEGPTLAAGSYRLRAAVEAAQLPAGGELTLTLTLTLTAAGGGGVIATARLDDPTPTAIAGVFRHPGGPLRFEARIQPGGAALASAASVWLSDFDVRRAP